jgi:hypothetical protein
MLRCRTELLCCRSHAASTSAACVAPRRLLASAVEQEGKCAAVKFASLAACKAKGCGGNDPTNGLGWYATCHAGDKGVVKAGQDCPNGPFCKAAMALSSSCKKDCNAFIAKYGSSPCTGSRDGCYARVKQLFTPGGAKWVLDKRPDLVAGSRYFALYVAGINGCQNKYTYTGSKMICGSIKLDTAKLLSGKVPGPGPSPKPGPAPAPTIAQYQQCGGQGGGCGGARPCADAA